MNYIVLDLEWNQCPFGKENENKSVPFEIIEIGAVKLTENIEILDKYHAIIKPVLYNEIHFRTKEVIQIDISELNRGRPFKDVAEEFFSWCGENIMMATWGSMDLTELQRNMKYFNVRVEMSKPLFYIDLQKIFSIQFGDRKERFSLENAVEFLNLEKEIPFHRADADTYYAAEIMKLLDKNLIKVNFSIDYYNNPKMKSEEIHITYDTYYKYVSREFDTREDAMQDKSVTATKCFLCHQVMKKKIRWFSGNNKIYFGLMYCEQHGWMKGKIRVKKTDEGKLFVIKTIKATNDEGANSIRRNQEEIRVRRHKKRRDELEEK